MGDLSKNFSVYEFTHSQTASRMGRLITPTSREKDRIIYLTRTLLQPIRDELGPMIITSGLRPIWLNDQIGGSKNSQHIKGEAADFIVLGKTPYEVATWINESPLPFDQLILEFDRWIHISLPAGPAIRNQALTARAMDGTTVFQDGIEA